MMQLITADFCSKCPTVKKYIEDNNIEGITLVDADNSFEYVSKLGVRGLPTLVVDKEIISGADKIIEFLKGVKD